MMISLHNSYGVQIGCAPFTSIKYAIDWACVDDMTRRAKRKARQIYVVRDGASVIKVFYFAPRPDGELALEYQEILEEMK